MDDVFEQRLEAIHDAVSVRDLLRAHGVKFKFSSDRQENFSCPFHGRDLKPSASYFPAKSNKPAHVWCYVCRERWDAISLFEKLTGFDGSFGALLREIEKTYGLSTPKAVNRDRVSFKKKPKPNEALLQVAERQLRNCVGVVSLTDWARLSVVLDRVYDLPVDEQKAMLDALLKKIQEKILKPKQEVDDDS